MQRYQIANVLRVKHKKTVTSRQIRNLIKKITFEEEGGDGNQHLVDILTKVEDEGGIVEYDEDPNGTVSSIFISTHKMKSAFVKSTSTVIQVDTSFGFDTARNKVLAFF